MKQLLSPVVSCDKLLLVSTQAALAENYWEYAHWSSSSSFHAEAVNAELCETLGATVFFRQFSDDYYSLHLAKGAV